ncbi:unnamed protein product, partial [Coregonus sp. 'balchen']
MEIAIPVLSVTLIKKTKTAILVPNALVITTTNEWLRPVLFVDIQSSTRICIIPIRDTTYKLLKSMCSSGWTIQGAAPFTSSAENSFRADCPSSLPLDLSGDFSDLDGVVRQRRQDMLESSSLGSQTPDYEKRHPRHIPELDEEGEMVVHADVHLQTPNQKHGAAHQNEPSKPAQGVEFKVKLLQPASLNILFLFLVSVLVLSSCYMAFKIVALEKRLNSLGSAP